jgi:hypothetical protein
MDVRIETFMRDAASDRGKAAPVVTEMTSLRLSLCLAAIRREAGAATATERERAFLAELDARVRDEMSRYPGTRTEAHLATVLGGVQAVMRTAVRAQLVA